MKESWMIETGGRTYLTIGDVKLSVKWGPNEPKIYQAEDGQAAKESRKAHGP